jgi:hypothetical protein
MLVYSNNLKKYEVKFDKWSIMRINVAWIKTYQELENILNENKDELVFLDYPRGSINISKKL